jgi:hypothetical protein
MSPMKQMVPYMQLHQTEKSATKSANMWMENQSLTKKNKNLVFVETHIH